MLWVWTALFDTALKEEKVFGGGLTVHHTEAHVGKCSLLYSAPLGST